MHVTLSNISWATVSWLATAAGAVQLVGLAFLIVFFAGAKPFGPLNDLCIGLAGILSAALAWQLLAALPMRPPALGWLAVAAAALGALVVAAGSALVISRTIGWVLAGFYMEFGYALIGLWLLALCFAAQASGVWPRGLLVLGFITVGLMLLGFLTLPGILRGIDSLNAAPWYVNLGQAGGLGWILLFPIWCLWLGRVLFAH